jgi:hypothetical protein
MCGKRVGHSLRERSSDRRVYTSALGYSVPPEVVIEIQKNERSGELPSMRSGEAPAAESPEERRHITGRTSRKKSDAALRELWQSLLWAALLSTLGALVAWGVYAALHRAATPSPPPSQNQPQVVARGPSPVRAKAPAPAAPRPAPGRELVIPVPAPAGAVPPSGVAPPLPPGPPPAAPPVSSPAVAAQNNDIDFVASQHSPQVRACYDRAFRNAGDKAPAGRVELSFVLVEKDGVGRAEQVLTELNMLGEQSVAGCLEELVGEWKFPRPRSPSPNPASGTSVAAPTPRLRYPFVFTPAPQ